MFSGRTAKRCRELDELRGCIRLCLATPAPLPAKEREERLFLLLIFNYGIIVISDAANDEVINTDGLPLRKPPF